MPESAKTNIPWREAAVIVVFAFLAYSNSFDNPFVFDDPFIIDNLRRATWRKALFGLGWRPLFNVTMLLNMAMSGDAAWSYHVFNLCAHIGAALFLFGLIRRTLTSPSLNDHFKNDATVIAFATTLLWCAHPLQTESVTYISQRGEILMGLFFLATLYCMNRGSFAASPRTRVCWNLTALAACVLGFASKEAMISIVIIAPLYDMIFLAPRSPNNNTAPGSTQNIFSRRKIFYVGLIGFLALAALVLHFTYGIWDTLFAHPEIPVWRYLLTQGDVIIHYLKLCFVPTSLCFDYDWPLTPGLGRSWLPLVLIGGLLAATIWTWRKHPAWAFPGIWFFVTLGPRSSVIARPEAAVEHRMYLPLVAVVVVVVLFIHEMIKNAFAPEDRRRARRVFILAILLLAIVLGALTFQRNGVYDSAFSLWADTVSGSPNNPRALNYLGIELRKRGDLEGAKARFERALEVWPTFELALNNLAGIHFETGDHRRAIELYRRSMEVRKTTTDDPLFIGNNVVTLRNMAKAFRALGQYDQALKKIELAVGLIPKNPEALYERGTILVDLKRSDEAERDFLAAIDLNPDFAPPINDLGVLRVEQGDVAEAERLFRRAVEADPNYIPARRNLETLTQRVGKNGSPIRE